MRVSTRTLRRISAFVGAVLLGSSPAVAVAGETAELRYDRSEAPDCPDAAALRRGVADRLGYDPFARTDKDRVVVVVRRSEGGHTGSVRVLRDDASPTNERSLVAPGDCGELVQTLALTISIALDPESAVAPRRVERRAPSAAPNPWTLTLAGGPSLGLGVAPAPVAGAAIDAEIRKGAWSMLLEARGTLPGSTVTERGEVSSWSFAGSAGPCGHFGLFFACLDGALGRLSARRSETGQSRAIASFLVGPRIGVALSLGSALELRLAVDALWSLARPRIAIGGKDVFEYAPGELLGTALVGVRL